MKLKITFILLLALGIAVAAGCTNSQSSSNVPDKLIVGLDDTFAPMGFRDKNGELVGFDIDMAQAVGRQMGVEIVFQPIDWDEKQTELDSGNIDCIWNGMSRTTEREEMMTLSQNYLNNKISIMTVPDVVIDSKEQLADYKIGTQSTSSTMDALKADDIYELISGNIIGYGTFDECILDMQAGRIQIMIVDDVLGQYKNKELNLNFNVSSVNFGDDFYAIGFRKSDTLLCQKVEEALRQIIASGEGRAISEKWFEKNLLLDIK